jgi:hypothetical protein
MDSKVVADQLGFPKCGVSVPMTPDEVPANAELVGVSVSDAQSDWIKLKATYRAGDELRYVSCASSRRIGAPGYSFFGLFRDNRIVLQVFAAIDN